MAETDAAPFGTYGTAAAYGVQAFASLAQGLLAAKRARTVAAYNADVLTQNAQAAAQAAELEAQQRDRAALIAEQDMRLAEQAGAYREARLRESHAATLGQAQAMLAASGVLMSGSPLRVYEEIARQQQLEVLVGQYQVKLQQRALQEEAVQQRYAAAVSRYGGQERLRIGATQAALTRALTDTSGLGAGLMSAGSSLLEGTGATLAARARLRQRGPTLAPEPGFERVW